MYQEIPHDEAKSIIDSVEEYILLDVREQEEFDKSHIPGAILIPYNAKELGNMIDWTYKLVIE